MRQARPRPGEAERRHRVRFRRQTYCALLIAETWKYFHDRYPAPEKKSSKSVRPLAPIGAQRGVSRPHGATTLSTRGGITLKKAGGGGDRGHSCRTLAPPQNLRTASAGAISFRGIGELDRQLIGAKSFTQSKAPRLSLRTNRRFCEFPPPIPSASPGLRCSARKKVNHEMAPERFS